MRQSRAVGSSLTSATRNSLARPQFQPSKLSLPAASSRPATSRWYSSEPEAKKEGEAASKDAAAEDPAKKELEAKNREIVDLKVCLSHFAAANATTNVTSRTNTSALSLNFVRCKTAQSEICKLPKTSPSPSSQKTSSTQSTTSTEPSPLYQQKCLPRPPTPRSRTQTSTSKISFPVCE